MPLVDLDLTIDVAPMPVAVSAFLHEADRRIEKFQRNSRVPGFVPSDYVRVYHCLRALAAATLAPGRRFCEWGSGFGVVAGLAAMLDFDAYGIEVEAELVDSARRLAGDFDLPVEFIHGSFIPMGGDAYADTSGAFAWLTPDGGRSYEELGLDPDDFDVIFAYPWPDEAGVTDALFDRYAGVGAVFVTYQGGDDIRLQRKKETRKRKTREAERRNHRGRDGY